MTAAFWFKFDVPFLLTDARSCVNESVTWLLTETDDRTQGGYLAGTPDGSAVLFLPSPPLTFSQQFKDPSLSNIKYQISNSLFCMAAICWIDKNKIQ